MSKFEKIKRLFVLLGMIFLLCWLFLLFADYSGMLPLFIISFVVFVQEVLFFIAARSISVAIELEQPHNQNAYEVESFTKLDWRIPFPFKEMIGTMEVQSKYRGAVKTTPLRLQIADGKAKTLRNQIILPCGYSKISYRNLRISDMFGLFYKKYPYVVEAEEVAILPRFHNVIFKEEEVVSISGFQKELLFTKEEELSELKFWNPGEPLNRVHWKLSARTEEPVMRVAEQTEQVSHCIYVSLCRNGNITESLEHGFALSYALMEQNMRYDICWFDSEKQEFCRKSPNGKLDIELIFLELMRAEMYEALPVQIQRILGFQRKQDEKTFVFRVG